MSLERTLFSVEVKETEKKRDYWATKPWAEGVADEIRSANVILVPWENFRDKNPALFPNISTDLFRSLASELSDVKVTVGVNQAAYLEIALHGAEIRLPTLFVTAVLVPVVLNILANRIDHFVFDDPSTSTVEMEVIVEGNHGRCISIKYKGPPSEMVATVAKQAEKCLPQTPQPKQKQKGKTGSGHHE